MEETTREDYDSPWKEVIERFFERFHIEVQGQRDPAFAKRVFICNCRIFDRYDLPVASLVILSDPHTAWRPDEFGYSIFGSEMKLRFPVVKLLDFGKNESRLRSSDNPFAIVTLAHLKALQTRRSPNARMKAKLELIRLLRKRKEMRRDVIDLLRFIDWELILPQNMEREFREIIRKENEEMGKPYVTSWERMAIQETMRANITEILEIRFGALPAGIAEILNGIYDAKILQELLREAVKCESLDAFAEHLPATV